MHNVTVTRCIYYVHYCPIHIMLSAYIAATLPLFIEMATNPHRHRALTCHEDLGTDPEIFSEDDDRSQTYTPQPGNCEV